MKKFFILFALYIPFVVLSQPAPNKPANVVCPPIIYPKLSRSAEEEGTVSLRFQINKDNTLGEVSIVKSSGFSRLDDAVLNHLPNCNFTAASRDSVTYDSTVRQSFTFRLEGPSAKKNPSSPISDNVKLESRKADSGDNRLIGSKSLNYSQQIINLVKKNIAYNGSHIGNLTAIVEIKIASDGFITGLRLVESSGNPGWDEAVLKGVVKTQILPIDSSTNNFSLILLHFRTKE